MEENLTTMSPYRRFGVKLRAWRESRKMSSKSLARAVSASDTYILQVENGLRQPSDPESSIGGRLYPLVDMLPTAHERFLWSQLSLYPQALRNLTYAILAHYGRQHEVSGNFNATLPIALGSLDSVFSAHYPTPDHRIIVIDNLAETLDHLRDVPDGAIIDWVFETTYTLGYYFPPFVAEVPEDNNTLIESEFGPGAMMLNATLRYSLNSEEDSITVHVSLERR